MLFLPSEASLISQTFQEIAPQQISSTHTYVQALVPKGEQVMFGKTKNKVYKAQHTSKHSIIIRLGQK